MLFCKVKHITNTERKVIKMNTSTVATNETVTNETVTNEIATNNVSLFIKRSEENQTKEFIIAAFASNNIGKVSDVTFIKKNTDNGKPYNGAIVTFEKWNNNALIQSLFDQMASSPDGTTKFYFNSNRYWFINIHKQKIPELEQINEVDSSLPDAERILQLENLVKSMSIQMHFMQTKQSQSDKTITEYERKNTHNYLINLELTSQLEDMAMERKRDEMERQRHEDLLNEEMEKITNHNETLYCRLTEAEVLIKDQQSIINYVEEQVFTMKELLIKVCDTDPIKTSINAFIDEYLTVQCVDL
jgi:hypothetical protein